MEAGVCVWFVGGGFCPKSDNPIIHPQHNAVATAEGKLWIVDEQGEVNIKLVLIHLEH